MMRKMQMIIIARKKFYADSDSENSDENSSDLPLPLYHVPRNALDL